MGGGAICLLARERNLKALILQSTFPSLDMFATHYLAPSFLLRDRFDNLGALRSYSSPVLVMHGRYDQMIPWRQAQRLAAASDRATFMLYRLWSWLLVPDRLPLWRDIDQFFEEARIR